MKKIVQLALPAFFCIANNNISAQWIKENANYQAPKDFMRNIYVPSAAVAWAFINNPTKPPVSYDRTINGGKTWTVSTPPMINNHTFLFSLFPISASTSWIFTFNAAAGTGAIYKTADGGSS